MDRNKFGGMAYPQNGILFIGHLGAIGPFSTYFYRTVKVKLMQMLKNYKENDKYVV